MYRNFIFSNVDEALPILLRDLLKEGDEVGSRNGVTKEFTHVGTTLTKPWQREILLPNRRANLAAQIAETMWVLSGRNDIEFLTYYLPRAKDFSDDGETWRGGYGPRLRQWRRTTWSDITGEGPGVPTDQIKHVVEMLRKDSLSRRAVAVIYDPEIDTEDGLDIPCNNWLTFTNRLGALDLHVGIRSNDIMWGWSGINAFEWSALQEIVAGLLGIGVGSLHFSTTSLHLYGSHWHKAGKLAEWADVNLNAANTTLEDSPRFDLGGLRPTIDNLDILVDKWFFVEEAIRKGGPFDHPDMVEKFPEPMLQSWLRIIQWWWTGSQKWLDPLLGTRLAQAAHVALQPPSREPLLRPHDLVPCKSKVVPLQGSAFIQYVTALHTQKHEAYGDSWKRRGEMLGILANIARKVDRLGGAETEDETSADTAIDLLVYLAKYRTWLDDHETGGNSSDDAVAANDFLLSWDKVSGMGDGISNRKRIVKVRQEFEKLEALAVASPNATNIEKELLVESILKTAYWLAYALWNKEQDPVQKVDPAYRGADAD